MELTTAPKKAYDAWPDIEHGGSNLLDQYMSVQTDLKNALKGVECQESYLGYIPSEGKFLAGFDVWFDEEVDCDECWGEEDEVDTCWKCCDGRMQSEESEEYEGNMVKFSLDNGEASDIEIVGTCGRFVYGDGVLKSMHSKFKDLVDIRLD